MQRFMSKRIDASGGENPPSTVPTIDDNGKVEVPALVMNTAPLINASAISYK